MSRHAEAALQASARRLPLGRLDASEMQVELLAQAADFCTSRAPISAVRRLMASGGGYDRAVWDEVVSLGWAAITVPEADGGMGLGLREMAAVIEPMGRRLMASPLAGNAIAIAALRLQQDAVSAQWLARLAHGSIAAVAQNGASGNWDVQASAAPARQDGADIALSGVRRLVEWGAEADLFLVPVTLDGAVRLALVERGQLPPGAIRAETIIDETRQSAAITLDGVVIREDQLLGAEASASAIAVAEQTALTLQSASMIGAAQGVLEVTLDYLSTRKQFGRLIGEYQALKHPLVDGYVAWEAARSLMLAAASSADAGDPGAINAARMAKAAASDAYAFLADRAIQFHGGYGFTKGCDAGLYRRNALWMASQWGDAAWQRRKLAQSLFNANN